MQWTSAEGKPKGGGGLCDNNTKSTHYTPLIMNPINIYTQIINIKTSVGGRRQASFNAATQSASRVRRGHLQRSERRQPPDLGRDGAVQVVVPQGAAQGRTRGRAATAPRRRGAAVRNIDL